MKKTSLANGFQVFLFSERGLDKHHNERVAEFFERHAGPVSARVIAKPVDLKIAGPNGSLAWADTFSTLKDLRAAHEIPTGAFIYLHTRTRNENNWYAVEDPDNMRNGFGHVGDFSWVTSAPGHIIGAHYLLKAIFNALVTEAGLDWAELMHEKARGCFYDFCGNKKELSLKLRTADICGDCLQVFRSLSIPESLLGQTVAIMEASRYTALNTGQFLTAEAVFCGWPFPVAITRHKVVQATNPLLRFMLLLDHFDSLVRYFYLAHEVVAERQPVMEDRPSLGWWVDRLAHSLKGEQHFREIVSISQRENVVALRNEKRGHGWMSANEDCYRSDAEHLEAVLDRIELELQPFLERHWLVIPRQIHLHDGAFQVEGEHLVGSHNLHPPFKARLDVDPRSVGLLEQNKVYLTNARLDRFRLISPYIRHDMCPQCKHPRLLITDGGRDYIDVTIGHRVQMEAAPS